MSKRVAFYTVGGKVTHHQELPEAWSDDEIALKILEFNSEHKERIARLVVVEEGSIEEYLLEAVKKARQYAKDSIQDALKALDEAKDAILDLEAV